MVSIRRRRLLAVCSGWNSFEEENGHGSANTVAVRPTFLDNTYKPKEGGIMCGREPNFELSEEEKQHLMKYNWDEFLAMTRLAITNKKSQRRTAMNQRKYPDNEWEMGEEQDGSSASGDDRAP